MTEPVRPRRLRRGDTIALVAPAGPVSSDRLAAALPLLESWGLRVQVGPCVGGRHPDIGYLSASDDERAAEFTSAWLDPAVSLVLAARGGYGTLRILDHVDWPLLRAAGPKILAGSSDITALHGAVNVHLGLTSLFSPMPAGIYFDQVAATHLRTTLFTPDDALLLSCPGATGLRHGMATGPLTGGNLALLTTELGASEWRARDGAIVVLEDVAEDVYRLDRMLTQLLRAGWFDGVAGIALGSWQGCGDPAEVRALMIDRLAPLEVPILWQTGFGHVAGAPTIPLGARAELNATAGTLRLLGPALA